MIKIIFKDYSTVLGYLLVYCI